MLNDKLDGIMIGRAVFHNPWFFNSDINPASKTPQERFSLLRKHISSDKQEKIKSLIQKHLDQNKLVAEFIRDFLKNYDDNGVLFFDTYARIANILNIFFVPSQSYELKL